MAEQMAASLLLLAGGESRRMGRPKASLPVGGVTLLEYVAARLEDAFAEVLVSANDPSLVAPALARRARVLRDVQPGVGPLAGLQAGLREAAQPVVLAVACDMPHVTPELGRRLVAACAGRDASVPVVGGVAEPVCAAYASMVAPKVDEALRTGRRSPRALLKTLDVAWIIDVPAAELRSLNTQADYRRFLDAMR